MRETIIENREEFVHAIRVASSLRNCVVGAPVRILTVLVVTMRTGAFSIAVLRVR